MFNKITPYGMKGSDLLVKAPLMMRVMKSLKNMGQHMVLICSIPLGIAWAPFWCCCVQPTLYLAHPDMAKNAEGCVKTLSVNLAGVAEGTFDMLSCGCCCFGCFGQNNPDDIFGH